MSTPKQALHSMRNDLTPILFFAELANTGDRKAQKRVVKEIVRRTESIHAELNVLGKAVKGSRNAAPEAISTQ